MKIAVISHIASMGGMRVNRGLLLGMKKVDPSLEIDFFIDPRFFAAHKNVFDDDFRSELKQNNITVKDANLLLHNPHLKMMSFIYVTRYSNKYANLLSNSLRKILYLYRSSILFRIIKKEKIKYSDIVEYDVMLITWPYGAITASKDASPIVFVPHDFNFTHSFGSSVFEKEVKIQGAKQLMEFFKTGKAAIVSTNFMKKEAEKFAPKYAHKINMIHLPPLSMVEFDKNADYKSVIAKFSINKPYIIFPTNLSPHKNVQAYIFACSILKERGHNLKFILVGSQTNNIRGKLNSGFYIDDTQKQEDWDIKGLGIVTNEEINALIKGAKVVVSCSLYEAGSGPGLDGWINGTPVAMSNILPFVEHIETQGVRAQLFDPRNAFDIADKIEWILNNPEKAKKDAEFSKKQIENITWEKTAREYLNIIKKAAKK